METYNHPTLGDVHISISKRTKRISIKIGNDSKVTLSVPNKSAVTKGLDFLDTKKEWIAKKLSDRPAKQPLKSGEIPHLGTTLTFTPTNLNNSRLLVRKGIIEVYYPSDRKIEDKEIQDFAKKGITFTLKQEAKLDLPFRVHRLAAEHNFRYNCVKINSAKTRWGSCSAENNINLSHSLMLLPKHLIDYVIIHELCHTVHKNHGKQFWELVESIYPNYKAILKEMKGYSTHI